MREFSLRTDRGARRRIVMSVLSGREHVENVLDFTLHCRLPDGFVRGRVCRHALAVRAGLVDASLAFRVILIVSMLSISILLASWIVRNKLEAHLDYWYYTIKQPIRLNVGTVRHGSAISVVSAWRSAHGLQQVQRHRGIQPSGPVPKGHQTMTRHMPSDTPKERKVG